jgi:hypothetical protein
LFSRHAARSQVLLREWVAKRAAHPDMARLSPEAFEGGVAALDAAVLASGAFSGALAVHFKPAQLSDALDTMHEHVLAALKACVNAPWQGLTYAADTPNFGQLHQ